jgi:hypothetical protein
VVSDTGLRPIPQADIGVLNSPLAIVTSDGGRFRITDMAPGAYIVTVRKLGYSPLASVVHVTAGETARMSFSLERLRVGIDTIRITERLKSYTMADFERRRAAGNGRFMNTDEIARSGSYDLANVLRRFATISIQPSGPMGELSIQSRRPRAFLATSCPMRVVVDGVPMPESVDISLLPHLRELAGIEVYSSATTVPMMYGSGVASCGAVLLWTKVGN